MGQYYIPCIVSYEDGKIKVLASMSPHQYLNGAKLMEHSYIGNNFVNAFETLLIPGGKYHKSMVIWAGDYADVEEGVTLIDEEDGKSYNPNVYSMSFGTEIRPSNMNLDNYSYLVNHTQKSFVDKRKFTKYHPLPLLTAEGNGGGGGNYKGNSMLVGTWSRNLISLEQDVPEDYSELICDF